MISAKEARDKLNEVLKKIEDNATALADSVKDSDIEAVEHAINEAISNGNTYCDVYLYKSAIDNCEEATVREIGIAMSIRLKRIKEELSDGGYDFKIDSNGRNIAIYFNFD